MNTTHSWTTAALVSLSIDPVDEDLEIDSEDEVFLLADMGVASQAMCSLVDGVVGGGAVYHVNVESRAPLGEVGPTCLVCNVIIVEAIKTVASGCALVSQHKELEARVYLDAGNNARCL